MTDMLQLWRSAFVQAHLLAAELPVPDLGNLTATAILGWYAWHTASRTLPALVRHFREELAETRREFAAQQEAFREALGQERFQRRNDSGAVVDALRELSRRTARMAEGIAARHPHGEGKP